jgi:hypothetical protein
MPRTDSLTTFLCIGETHLELVQQRAARRVEVDAGPHSFVHLLCHFSLVSPHKEREEASRSKEGNLSAPVPVALLPLPLLPCLPASRSCTNGRAKDSNSMSLHDRLVPVVEREEGREDRCTAVVARLYMDLTRVKLLTEGKGNEVKSAREVGEEERMLFCEYSKQ